MKTIATIILMLTATSCLASSGTTFCPFARDFKFNEAAGSMEAPGGWSIMLGGRIKIKSFVKVDASEINGEIYACTYNVNIAGTNLQMPIPAEDYLYVADNVKASNWHRGADDEVCVSSNPMTCSFHLEK